MSGGTTFQFDACLRLGASCECSETVDCLGYRGLSCKKSAGRIAWHASINDIIIVLFPSPEYQLSWTLWLHQGWYDHNAFFWEQRKSSNKISSPLVWDTTCIDKLAPSYLPSTACCATFHVTRELANAKASLLICYVFKVVGPMLMNFGTDRDGKSIVYKGRVKARYIIKTPWTVVVSSFNYKPGQFTHSRLHYLA